MARNNGRIFLEPATVVAVALALILGGCVAPETPGDGQGPDGPSASVTDGTSPTDDGDPATTTETDTSESTTDSGAADTDSNGLDLQLFTLPECAVVPGGALSGADVLNMFVAVRNGGPGEFSSLAPVTISSDTGLGSSLNTAISTGSSFTAMQVDLGAGDYNQTHRFTITVDPNEETLERDESNNALQITVPLSDRPSGATDVGCTSP